MRCRQWNEENDNSCSTDSELACSEARLQYEASGYVCSCQPSRDGLIIQLACHSTCGDLCINENKVCFRETIVKEFQDNGEVDYLQKDMQYTLGRREFLRYKEASGGSCFLSVDGTPARTAPSKNVRVKMQRSNIESGAILDLCDQDLIVDDGGLRTFSTNEFQDCVDRAPSNGICSSAETMPSIGSDQPPVYVYGSITTVAFDGSTSCGRDSFSLFFLVHNCHSGTGIHAATCNGETDFDSQSCVVENEENCSVMCYEEQGVSYHICVHGYETRIETEDHISLQ
jgi:hypothetical protein